MSWPGLLLPVAALLVVGLAVYAFWIEPCRIRLSRVELAIPNLPDSLDGLTICHLSDTHTSRYGRLEKITREILAGIDADLCVITGDLLRRRDGMHTLRRALSALKPRLGVFAVPGNGDYKLRVRMSELAAELTGHGINVLLNSRVTLSSNGSNLHIIGVDDPFLRLDDLTSAMSGIAEEGFRLLLAHSPDVLMSIGDRRVDLILAGHTHGGQVRLPFVGALWLHSRYRLPISDGYYDPETLSRVSSRDVSGACMYVSRGLSWSAIPIRFMCPPEIVLITLRRKFEERAKVVY